LTFLTVARCMFRFCSAPERNQSERFWGVHGCKGKLFQGRLLESGVWVIGKMLQLSNFEVSLDDGWIIFLSGKSPSHTRINRPRNIGICLASIEPKRFQPDSRGTLDYRQFAGNRYNGDTMADLRFLAFLRRFGPKGAVFRSKHLIMIHGMQVLVCLKPIPAKGVERPTFPWIFSLKFLKKWMDRMGRLFKWRLEWIYAFAQWYQKCSIWRHVSKAGNVEPYLGCR